MASVSMMASFVGGAAAVAQQPRRTLFVAKAAARAEGQGVAAANSDGKEEMGSNGRRAAMLAVAAAAVTAVAGQGMVALADEPKRGTPEARKKYAPICVTMPTARVCHKIA